MTFRILAALCCMTVMFGCSKTDKPGGTATAEGTAETPKEVPKLDTKGVLLQAGYAALLVAFPEPAAAGDWLSMVTLHGQGETELLPRIPLASSHSVTVLNIPPGEYTVDAKAWVRKNSPYAGGISKPVKLNAGELLLLRGSPILNKDGSLEGVELLEAGRTTWSLKSPPELTKYIAENAGKARG